MDLNNLFEKLKQTSDNKIVYYENGARKEKKFRELYVDVQRAASFLNKMSIKRGARVGILGKNCYAWVVADLACLSAGYVTVPLEPNHMVEVDDLIREYDLSLVLTNMSSSFWTSKLIMPFSAIMDDGKNDVEKLNPVKLADGDVFTFNFTSGTSGRPKAIEIKKSSFDNLIAESQALFGFRKDDRFLVFLPLNVYLERCYIYSSIIIGFDVILISAELVFKAIQSESPTVIIGVPYFFENVQKVFLAKVQSKFLFNSLLKLYLLLKKIGLGSLVGNRFILFTKLWGGKMRYLLCGSAPIRRSVLDFYDLMGMRIYEGYGMNEIGGMITLNHPAAVKTGSVGKAFPGKTISFDDYGQIIVQSKFHANTRYFKDEDNLLQTTYLTDDKVATGDVGHADNDGFVYITGRIKDLIILSNGIKIHPAPEEERLEEELEVSNCCIFGDGKPYLTALIVPNGNKENAQQIRTRLDAFNAVRPAEKQIRNFFLSQEPFSIDNGLLTPAFKRNRKYLYQRYALEFEKLY